MAQSNIPEHIICNVAVNKISAICNPFLDTCWAGLICPISINEVALAVSENRFIDKEIKSEDRDYHIERIAYFVLNETNEPIGLDLYCYEWIVFDGNHRLAAAIFSKKKSIRAYFISGIEQDWVYNIE